MLESNVRGEKGVSIRIFDNTPKTNEYLVQVTNEHRQKVIVNTNTLSGKNVFHSTSYSFPSVASLPIGWHCQ